MKSMKENGSISVLAAGSLALLWGIFLFGILEVDFWTAKMMLVGALAPISCGLQEFFYGC